MPAMSSSVFCSLLPPFTATEPLPLGLLRPQCLIYLSPLQSPGAPPSAVAFATSGPPPASGLAQRHPLATLAEPRGFPAPAQGGAACPGAAAASSCFCRG